jgi:hypothetical protein
MNANPPIQAKRQYSKGVRGGGNRKEEKYVRLKNKEHIEEEIDMLTRDPFSIAEESGDEDNPTEGPMQQGHELCCLRERRYKRDV